MYNKYANIYLSDEIALVLILNWHIIKNLDLSWPHNVLFEKSFGLIQHENKYIFNKLSVYLNSKPLLFRDVFSVQKKKINFCQILLNQFC